MDKVMCSNPCECDYWDNWNAQLVTAMIDNYVQNDCAEDAMRLKWLRGIL